MPRLCASYGLPRNDLLQFLSDYHEKMPYYNAHRGLSATSQTEEHLIYADLHEAIGADLLTHQTLDLTIWP